MPALVALALLAAGQVPFSLKPGQGPGRYELQLYAEPRARAQVTFTPPPPAPDGALAEVALAADEEATRWLLRALAGQPVATTGQARWRLTGRWRGDTVELEAFSIGVDLKKGEGWFTVAAGADPARALEGAQQRRPPVATAWAALEAPSRVTGPGARVAWAGRLGLLLVEPGGTYRFWDPAKGAARPLGRRKGTPSLVACGATGVCAVADPDVTVLPAESVKLPARAAALWVSQDGRWVGGELESGEEGQHLWAYERAKRRLLRWDGPDDLAHRLRFVAWGSKGVVFERSTGCAEGEEPPAVGAACLWELEPAPRWVSIGAARQGLADAVSPDRRFRVATAAGSVVLEALDAGTRQVIDVRLVEQPVWLSDRLALVSADPLAVLDIEGVVHPLIEDRIQFFGGQLDGAIVWYQTAEGVFVARVVTR